MGGLPVGGEAHEAGDVGDDPMGIGRVDGDHVEHLRRPLQVALEDRERAVAPGLRLELLERARAGPAQLGAGGRRDGDHGRRVGSRSGSPASVDLVDRAICPSPRSSRTASSRWRRSNRAIRETRRISSASRRHGPAVIIRVSATSSSGSAMARRPCSRSRISGVAKSDSPPTTV